MSQRSRSRGNSAVPTYEAGYSNFYYSNSPTEVTPRNGGRIGVYEEMTDYLTPGFRKRRNQGEIFNNMMSRRKFTYTASSNEVLFLESPPTNVGGKLRTHQEWKGINAVIMGPLKPPVDPNWPTGHLLYGWEPLLDENLLVSRAATAALSDTRSKGAQGLVIVSELKKTLATLRNPFAATLKHLRKIPKDLRRGSRRNPKSLEKVLVTNVAAGASSQYLTWFYGLRTLMFDIEEVMAALELPTFDRQTGRAFQSDETISQSTAKWNADTGSNNATVTTSYSERCEVRAGALVLIEAKTTAQRLGFDIRKIPEAAWELMPWSFVVDWFLNVQDTIGALEAVVSNKFLAEWVVKKRTLTWERQVSGHYVTSIGQPWLTIGAPCVDRDKVIVETYDRAPQNLSKLIAPSLRLSFDKVPTLAAVSLVVQQLTKGK